jgi:hypothetical protein
MDKIDSVQVVFFHPSTDGEDVGVKDDVIWIEAQFFHKEMVSSGADTDFVVCFCCLCDTETKHYHLMKALKSQCSNFIEIHLSNHL